MASVSQSPFYESASEVDITDEKLHLDITEENIGNYKSGSGYLPCGLYRFVANDIFFMTANPVAACKSKISFPLNLVENSNILKDGSQDQPQLRTRPITVIVSDDEYEAIMGMSRAGQAITMKNYLLVTEAPELA